MKVIVLSLNQYLFITYYVVMTTWYLLISYYLVTTIVCLLVTYSMNKCNEHALCRQTDLLVPFTSLEALDNLGHPPESR